MTGNVTVAPLAYLSVAPQVSVAVPFGSSPLTAELPGEQALERRHRRGGRRLVGERADDRDPGAAGVEAVDVRADDAAGDAAVPAFVDGPEAVDEEVVGDVVPAQALGVIRVDAAHQGRSVGGGVEVAAGGVVDEGHLDRGVGRRRPLRRLSSAPHSARVTMAGAEEAAEAGGALPMRGDGGRQPAHGAGDARGDAAVLGGIDGDEADAAEGGRSARAPATAATCT